MTTRRDFLKTTVLASAGLPLAVRADRESIPPTFGLVADAQFADIDAKGTRFYRRSIDKLGAAVEHFNREYLQFCVHLGDLIDREWRSFDKISEPLAKSRHGWEHLLGNHDFDVINERKRDVPKRLGLEQRYWHFDVEWCRFVFLDTNDVSTYAYSVNSRAHIDAEHELKRAKAANLRQAQSWNGAIGLAQLAWLDRTCTHFERAKKMVVIFAHHPVFPDNEHNLWNSAEVLDLIDRHPNVVAWINGHNHAGSFAERNGVPFITMRGMVETADTTAFATARVLQDRIMITGHGREPSRELRLRWTLDDVLR